MNITVNGKKEEVANSISILELINQYNLKIENIVVELNEDIILKDDFSKISLKGEDSIEFIQFVAGG